MERFLRHFADLASERSVRPLAICSRHGIDPTIVEKLNAVPTGRA